MTDEVVRKALEEIAKSAWQNLTPMNFALVRLAMTLRRSTVATAVSLTDITALGTDRQLLA